LRTGAGRVSVLIAVTSDDTLNRRACLRARDAFGITELVARVNDPSRREEFLRAGIRTVSVPMSISAALEHAYLRPNLFHLLVDRPKQYE
jgi:Trk K+ transport system NAD-binding subunit